MVGMSWDNNNERKMVGTFGFGRGVFPPGGFVDAAAVALELGHAKRGLASLANSVLGITLPKSQHVSTSTVQLRFMRAEGSLQLSYRGMGGCRPASFMRRRLDSLKRHPWGNKPLCQRQQASC